MTYKYLHMKNPIDAADYLASRAGEDGDFRERLLATPRKAIEEEFGVTLAEDHEIHVHEETYAATHVVLPPRSKFSEGPNGRRREPARHHSIFSGGPCTIPRLRFVASPRNRRLPRRAR